MTVNQKTDALAMLQIRFENIHYLLERETDPELRAGLIESLEELAEAYAAISALVAVG